MTTSKESVGKIAVAKTGAIAFNGAGTTLEKLRDQLADLRRKNGVVWYYREAGGSDPPEQAMAVMKLVIEHGLPISMSTKPDYSDVVMPDGTVRARDSSRPN